jgi:hypothetical protein
MYLAGVMICAVAVSVHGQGRPVNGVPAQGGGSTTPGGAVTVQIYPQLMHIRFTKAVTATADGQTQDIRAHLESPVLGTVVGSTQKVVVLPSDIDVNLDINLGSADAQRTNARMSMRIASANVDPAFGRQRFFSAEVTHDFAGWPKPGDVLIPAGATLSVPYFGSASPMGQANLAATDPNANRADDSYPSRPILAGIDLPIALVDTPIDVNNAGSNKLFRAQLTQDMQYPASGTALPVGAIKLTKGTEVYLRSYEPDPSAPLGHIAVWSVDLIVMDGKKIPVKGLGIREPFTPGSMAISPDGKRKIPMIMWPLGQTRQFDIAEQQEVSSNGSTLWTYPSTTEVAPASSAPAPAPAPTPSTSTARPNPPTPAANPNTPPAGATPGLPPDVQQRIDDNRKRAEELRACQQKAIAEHQGDPLGLARAISACQQAARPPR